MKTRPIYRALCTRSGDWWAIDVPTLKGVHTQARRLDQADAMVRDAIALLLEVEPSAFDVEVIAELPQPLQSEVERTKELRDAAQHALDSASQATARTVALLLASRLTVRDAGRLLGLSHQKVAQLTRQPRP